MSSVASTSDRYLSFKGINFDGQASRMITRITLLKQDDARSGPTSSSAAMR
jgi:hypothetical protein